LIKKAQNENEKFTPISFSNYIDRSAQTQKKSSITSNVNNNRITNTSNNKPNIVERQLPLNFNSTKKNISHQFEDDLQKALEESKKTFEIEQIKYHNLQNFDDFDPRILETEMEMEEFEEKNIFDSYKKMIYSELKYKNEVLDENSMFPLHEEDLDPAYLRLEKKNRGF
jgi:hypothetical protein